MLSDYFPKPWKEDPSSLKIKMHDLHFDIADYIEHLDSLREKRGSGGLVGMVYGLRIKFTLRKLNRAVSSYNSYLNQREKELLKEL